MLGAQDGSGTIEYNELQGMMERLGALCSDSDVQALFHVRLAGGACGAVMSTC